MRNARRPGAGGVGRPSGPRARGSRRSRAPLDAKSFAQRVEVAASPVHAFRYNQPIPAPNQTKALLTRRRAFYPGERVSLAFRLPPGATLAAPLRARVALSLHDLLGAKLADLGEAALSAAPAGVAGTLEWTVPDGGGGPVPARRPLLGRGRPAARHPQQRRLRDPGVPAAARGGAGGARPRAGEGRDGRRPRPRRQPALDRDARRGRRDALVRLRPGAARLGFREAPARDREGVRRPPRGGRGPVEGPHRRLHEGVPLRGRRHAPALRAVRAALLRPGEGLADDGGPARLRLESPAPPAPASSASATRRASRTTRRSAPTSTYPDVGFVVLAPYGRGESAGYNGVAEGDVLRAMDHVAAGLQRRPRPRAPHRPLDGRRRHLAHRPALPRPLRLDLAGVRRRRHGPHALDGGLERARPGADGPDRLHADRRERRRTSRSSSSTATRTTRSTSRPRGR